MNKRLLALTLVTLTLSLTSPPDVSATPALKELPSITFDTMHDSPFEPEMAESVGPIGALAAYTTMSRLRKALRGDLQPQESQGIRYYLHPMRLAKSMGSGMVSMAKTFYDTFQQQFAEQYKHLSEHVQETVIPQAANLIGVWENPPQIGNEWGDMEGI